VAKLLSAGSVTVSETVAAGTDALILASAGDISLSADVTAGRHASVIAAGGIVQNANITATSGDLYANAQGGSIGMSDGATGTAGGNIRYAADGNITLGQLDSANGDVAVRTDNGSILSAGGSINVTGSGVQLWAPIGAIGQNGGNGPILLDADILATRSQESQYIAQTAAGGNLVAGTVDAFDVNRAYMDSSTVPVTVNALSDMESSFDAINLAVLNGSLTIDDPVNAGTTIGIAASESINQNADINATGDIEVEAQNGSITMVGGTETRSASGDITYRAGSNITFDRLVTPAGSVILDAGGALAGGTIDSFGSITLSGASLTMDELRTRNHAEITLTGDLTLARLDVAGQLDMGIGGNAQVNSLDVGQAGNMRVGGRFTGARMNVGSGAITVGGEYRYNTIMSRGGLNVRAGSITFDSLQAPSPVLNSRGDIAVGTVQANDVDFSAGGSVVDNNSMINAARITIAAGGNVGASGRPLHINTPTIDRITADGDIYLLQEHVGMSSLGLISAGGGFDVTVPNGGFRNGNGGALNLVATIRSRSTCRAETSRCRWMPSTC